MTIASGTRLGPYEIVAPLGAGGMGEVYRARDARLDREVAVKVLPASYSADPDRLRRFEQEARAVGRLNHPNVLAIHDVGDHEGVPYVVSELLEGSTLRERLAGGTLPARKAVDYALQIARGLGAAHEKGIVHRDLKPENVFVTSDGRVKILDFGLAKLTRPDAPADASAAPTETRGTEPGVVLGTVGYMAPEQVRGLGADARADIFAFGAILYEMLSGRRAFRGGSSADVMSAILKEEPPPLSETGRGVPPPLERLVAHCLEKNPEERFQSARDIAYELEALSGVSASEVRAPRDLSRRPLPRLGLSLVIGIAAVAAVAGLLAGRASKPARSAPPEFRQLTYRRGSIGSARFAPDGQSVVYSARWDGAPARLYLKRPDAADAIPLDQPSAEILAISPAGEMFLALSCLRTHYGACSGTLAQAPLAGGAPRQIREGVQAVDLAPDGTAMAVVRDVADGAQLEYPSGKVLYKTVGHLSYPRVSRQGDRIAFIDHPERIEDAGSVAVIDLSGKKTTLAGPFSSAQGLAWSPRGDEVWFTASNPRALFAVTLSGSRRLLARAPGHLTLLDVSRNGSVLTSFDSERTSTQVSGSDTSTDRDLSWLNWTLAVDLSEDGKTALLEEEGGSGEYMSGLRPTDGSPIVRLTTGSVGGLSYDGKWVVARPDVHKMEDALVPTGPGETVPLPPSNVQRTLSVSWFPDGQRFLFTGIEPGHRPRLYVRDVPRGMPRPITPEGFITQGMSRAVSPDGRFALAIAADGATWIFPVDGGESRRVDAIDPKGERPLRWTADGRGLYVRQWEVLPFEIVRLDLATGKRTPLRSIAPPDPAGAEPPPLVRLSADGRTCVYSPGRKLSTLYVLEGLR